MRRVSGISLIELMVAITVASLLSVGVVAAYSSNTAMMTQQMRRSYAAEEGRNTFEMLSEMILHSQFQSVNIDYGSGSGDRNDADEVAIAGDEITVGLKLPDGFPVWPNMDPPYNNTDVTISWTATGAQAYEIHVLHNGNDYTLAGDSRNRRIANLDLWPLDKNGGFQANATDLPLSGYRIVLTTSLEGGIAPNTMAGVVFPRNCC